MARFKPTSSWDPILLISQIVAVQTLHYLILSLIIPPLLAVFAEPTSLSYEGGPSNVGMVMDWREMAGQPTVRGMQGWKPYSFAWVGGKKVGYRWRASDDHGMLDATGTDPVRGWIIAMCWLCASGADIYVLSTLIRKPRMILDFSLTLVFNHLVLTSYYSASIPTSLFFYAVVLVGCASTVIAAEQICVKREMREGLAVNIPQEDSEEAGLVEEMEMGSLGLPPRRD